ncbi:hypothetical protein MesoLjLb_75950 [Mesorhizobium sp. L-8-3]|nr:hypothetical protein MesoLjLb_75950 [Mesorhizobium sp. L-8-3]
MKDGPVAAGSVAFVLRSEGAGKDELALKIVRPGSERLIAWDLSIMRWLLRKAGRWIKVLEGLQLDGVFDSFAVLVTQQTDMTKEREFLERLRAILGPEIVVPRSYPSLCSSTVLAMEYVDSGQPITSPDIPIETYRTACLLLLRKLYQMLFIHGLVHCDLHPGNVRIAADGRLVIFDFGLVAEMTDRDRILFRDFFIALADRDTSTAVHCIVESITNLPGNSADLAFERGVRDILTRHSGLKAGEFLIARFVMELFELQRKHGCLGAPGFANAVWALAMFEGLVRSRFPELDFQAEARPFVVSGLIRKLRQLVV